MHLRNCVNLIILNLKLSSMEVFIILFCLTPYLTFFEEELPWRLVRLSLYVLNVLGSDPNQLVHFKNMFVGLVNVFLNSEIYQSGFSGQIVFMFAWLCSQMFLGGDIHSYLSLCCVFFFFNVFLFHRKRTRCADSVSHVQSQICSK